MMGEGLDLQSTGLEASPYRGVSMSQLSSLSLRGVEVQRIGGGRESGVGDKKILKGEFRGMFGHSRIKTN